ncbi:MAG: MotA/TolQ/ExbB proton channel family protein [Verrucomicrobiota bacterium]
MKVRVFKIWSAISFAALAATANAASLEEVNAQAEKDLRDSLVRLSEVRGEMADKRIPIMREINALRQETRELQREVERAQRLQDSRSVGLDALEDRTHAIREENDYIGGLMTEFFQSLRAQMTASEAQRYEARVDAVRTAMDTPDLSTPDLFAKQIDGVALGIERLDDRLGGSKFQGEAIAPSGTLEKGTFLEIGPVSLFASSDSATAGYIDRHGVDTPKVVSVNETLDLMAANVAQGGSGELMMDVTLGDALAIEGAKETIWQHIEKGGIWVMPILFFAGVSTILAIFKVISIYRIRVPDLSSLSSIIALVKEGDKEGAEKTAAALPWKFGNMISSAVKFADKDKELVEEVMYEKMLEAQPKIDRFLSIIAVTAAVAPLLGLLGTVTGMINTFKLITLFGTGDARSLSGGISEALITTEFGLIVAIPALVAHSLLTRKAQSIMAHMEKMSVAFLNGLPKA